MPTLSPNVCTDKEILKARWPRLTMFKDEDRTLRQADSSEGIAWPAERWHPKMKMFAFIFWIVGRETWNRWNPRFYWLFFLTIQWISHVWRSNILKSSCRSGMIELQTSNPHLFGIDLQGLINVLCWGCWASLSSVRWRIYPHVFE